MGTAHCTATKLCTTMVKYAALSCCKVVLKIKQCQIKMWKLCLGRWSFRFEYLNWSKKCPLKRKGDLAVTTQEATHSRSYIRTEQDFKMKWKAKLDFKTNATISRLFSTWVLLLSKVGWWATFNQDIDIRSHNRALWNPSCYPQS